MDNRKDEVGKTDGKRVRGEKFRHTGICGKLIKRGQCVDIG